jgi:hypothetical protein
LRNNQETGLISGALKNQNQKSVGPVARRSGGGGGPRNQYGLTFREEAFARYVAGGQTLSEAYRSAYTTANMKPETICGEAHLIGKRPWVRERIDGLREALDADALNDAVSIRLFIVEQLWNEAVTMTSRASERLKALELLGKLNHVQAFVKRVEVQLDHNPEAIESRIQEILFKYRSAETN